MKTVKIKQNLKYPIPKLRGSLASISFPAFGEIKYDGEFTFIFFSCGRMCTCNKYGRVRTDFPELKNIRKLMNCNSAVMISELYYGEGKRNDLYKLNSNKESNDLHLRVFDLIELDGVDITKSPLIDRKEKLHDILPGFCCAPKVLKDKDAAKDYFDWTVANGYEGTVIKSMNTSLVSGPCDWVKLKMKDRSDYTVTLIDPNKERIEVSVPNQNGIVIVGVKASLRYKRHINVGDKVTIEHQGVLASGSLRHPVLIPKKEWR